MVKDAVVLPAPLQPAMMYKLDNCYLVNILKSTNINRTKNISKNTVPSPSTNCTEIYALCSNIICLNKLKPIMLTFFWHRKTFYYHYKTNG